MKSVEKARLIPELKGHILALLCYLIGSLRTQFLSTGAFLQVRFRADTIKRLQYLLGI